MFIQQIFSKTKGILINNKKIIENFSYLSIIQVVNMLLPLLSYPYVLRVLGIAIYGKIIFAQAIIGYFVILIGFGFSVTATREISVHRSDPNKLNEILSSVVVCKVILFFVCLIFLVPFLSFYGDVEGQALLFILTLWLCLYEILFPGFYFQGIEQMKYISIISLIVKVITVGSIFIFIHQPSDYIYMPLLNLAGTVVAGIISFYIILAKHKLKIYIPKVSVLKGYYKEAVPVFLSNVSVQVYVSTNKVLIGLFLGMVEVSYYDMGEKILSILRIPQSLIIQTVFPKVSLEKDNKFVKMVFKYSVILNIALFILLFVFSKHIILMLGGESMLPSKWVILILGLTLPVVATSSILGMLILIPFGFNKVFSKTVMFSGLIFIVQFFLLWIFNYINIYSLCGITLITEIFVSLQMFYYCMKYKLWEK